MIAYAIYPIDFNWEFVTSVKETALKIAARDIERNLAGDTYETPELPKFWERYEEAKSLATAVGWEGDFSGGEADVFFLPVEGQFDYGFVWKQSNNGDTFVISPVVLPWLDDISHG